MTKWLTIVVFLCLCSQAFAVNAITHVALSDSCDGGAIRSETSKIADSSTFEFNPLFLSGGFWRDELTFVARADGGTCYLVIDNKYDAGGATDIWISSKGDGGRKTDETLEKYSWNLPDSIALTAGTHNTVVENYVYLTYNGGTPALKRHAAMDQVGNTGDMRDSMIFVGSIGLGAVSGSDEEIRYFDTDQPSLYKFPLRTTLHGWETTYHKGIDITAEEHTFTHLRGFLHSGTDNPLVPAASTDDVSLYVPVYNDSNYARWDSLDNFAEYSTGEAVNAGHYFWVVIWGAVSIDTTEYKLYMNIQAGTNTYTTLFKAEQDEDGMMPTSIPAAFHETGFLIAAMIISGNNDEIQTLTDGSTYRDLRGLMSGASGGAGAPPTDSTQVDAWNFVLPPELKDTIDAVSVGRINNTDTTTVITGDFLTWNGSMWVGAPYDTSFIFEIASFSDGQTATQLIGQDDKAWLAATATNFTASYNNGPPVSGKVQVSGTGVTAWGDSLDMGSGSDYEGPTANADSVDYPTKSGSSVTVTFTLASSTAGDTDNDTETITFLNYIFYGDDDIGSGFADADIHTLDSTLSTDHTQTWNINAGVGQYVVFAYPTTLTQLDGGNDYEDDGLTDFRWNGFACGMLDAHEVVSVENENGYSENYDVWASTVTNLGNDQLQTYTSGGTINWIHYGMTTETDSSAWDAGDIHAADDSTITNTETGTWTVTAGAGEYVMFAWPVRVDADDDLEFKLGALPGGFRTTQTISVTNSNGWTEDYRMTTSQNANLAPSGETLTTGRGL